MIVLDTDILIDAARGRRPTLDFLESLEARQEELGVSSLSVAEFLRGIPEDAAAQRIAHQLLAAFVEIPFGPRAAQRYGRLTHSADRTGKPIPPVDAMIAATALEAGARFATGNKRHFVAVRGLEFVDG